MFTPDVIDVS